MIAKYECFCRYKKERKKNGGKKKKNGGPSLVRTVKTDARILTHSR